ncbi:AMME chromosomal region protein 1-like [Lobulomyces angularis]|nr:AMME chromosomal region protein 1-like [Lobulomyces angularis]
MHGFGTVLYENPQHAQDAINRFNNHDWNGRKIEVQFDKHYGTASDDINNKSQSKFHNDKYASEPNFEGDSEGDSNLSSRALYVGNLPFSTAWQDLKDLFREVGNVFRVDIPTGYDGRSKGYATVMMETIEDARKVVEVYNGFELKGRRIEVREDYSYAKGEENNKSFKQKTFNKQNLPGTRLFVGNLPYNIAWQELKDLFREVGNVVRADVQLDHEGRSRGFGQVVMSTAEEAKNAVASFNGKELSGRTIVVREDRYSNEGNGENTQVFVGNLPYSTRWQGLKDIFRPFFLNPVHSEIILDNNGKSKGCGFVKFSTTMDAERAVEEVNGIGVEGRKIIDVLYSKLNGNSKPDSDHIAEDKFPLFVSWYTYRDTKKYFISKKLRGCIGNFSGLPLRTGLEEYALTSALRDRRFFPIGIHELKNLSCGVSLLTNFEEGDDYLDWEIGKHGIWIEFIDHNGKKTTATYLPEVMLEQNWEHEEAIHSLLRKGGFKGEITVALKRSIVLTRYQSKKEMVTYEEWINYSK